VVADARAGGFGAPLNHLIGVRLGQGMAGELVGRVRRSQPITRAIEVLPQRVPEHSWNRPEDWRALSNPVGAGAMSRLMLKSAKRACWSMRAVPADRVHASGSPEELISSRWSITATTASTGNSSCRAISLGRVDVIAFDNADQSIRAYEIKHGNGQFDAGKIRSITRDLKCIQVLLKKRWRIL
jgi:hypothetical protein